MFWSNRPPRSLALQLSVWYAASAFLLLTAGTGFLYWELVQSSNTEDDQYLSEKVNTLRMLLNERDFRTLKWEVEGESSVRPAVEVLSRVFSSDGRILNLSQWSRARVNIDYHIALDTNYYSVPYNLVHDLVEVRSTPTTIEIFYKGQRVWAPSIGPSTARLFERILADKPHPEMGYRSCLGIIRLAGQYSVARMEAAAERALVTGACRYQSVKSILKNSLDALPVVEPTPSSPPPPHDNIRGAEYFD
jgi:hypothetical protein